MPVTDVEVLDFAATLPETSERESIEKPSIRWCGAPAVRSPPIAVAIIAAVNTITALAT